MWTSRAGRATPDLRSATLHSQAHVAISPATWASLFSGRERLAIQIDETASRIGILEAKRLVTLQKISSQQA